ncbi:MAG: histidine--tRNA ligase, partial [Methylobacteriaceae bacterium]|nr:histidine--tRNA ligase [Methylobacteriaceae bacterium]
MSSPDRPKARLPRGFADRPAADLAATERMLARIRDVYELYGFEAIETPFVEYTEALGKFLPDLDRPNEGVFSFQDDDESWLSLRYDLTAPLARHVAERLDAQSLTLPFRSYRAGWVFRNEKPGPGRFRQFMQFDADTVGSASPAADAEICMMMADTLEAVGIKRGDYVVKVNNRKILDGVMEAIGLGGDENAGRRLTVLRALDKYDRLGAEGVRELLGPGRRDESGDFTKGAGLDPENAQSLLSLLTGTADLEAGGENAFEDDAEYARSSNEVGRFTNTDTLTKISCNFKGSALFDQGLIELRLISDVLRSCDFGTRRIRIDPSVVRGLEYYTGPVFEAELTFPVVNDDGQTVRFGSVA